MGGALKVSCLSLVAPEGKVHRGVFLQKETGGPGAVLTVTVVMQVEELVVPLCYYAKGVLEEGHHDQEAADGGHVSVAEKSKRSAKLRKGMHAW